MPQAVLGRPAVAAFRLGRRVAWAGHLLGLAPLRATRAAHPSWAALSWWATQRPRPPPDGWLGLVRLRVAELAILFNTAEVCKSVINQIKIIKL